MDSPQRQLIALIGHPVDHSLSPVMHNTAFAAQKLPFQYVVHDVEPGNVEEALAGMYALNYRGGNVTIPHKTAVRSALVDESEQARAVGAVNTLVRTSSGWMGQNTDVDGFLRPLEPHLPDLQRTSSVLIFGAGGAARAVVYGLLTSVHPESITLAVRSPERARPMVTDMERFAEGTELAVTEIAEAGDPVRRSDLIVNATPVGMHPDVDATPWQHTDDFADHQIVYDLIYRPDETQLLRQAASRGATCINGVEMLIGQAAAAYSMWTGQEMPVDLVRTKLSRSLQQ